MSEHPDRPRHPERICWGCDKRCPASDLACGDDKARAPHPIELFGDDWADWVRGEGRTEPTRAVSATG
jgi:hypothetical protein